MKKTFCLLLVVFSRLIFSQTELKALINIKIDTLSVKEYDPENNIEAIILAINKNPNLKEVILIADDLKSNSRNLF